MILLIDLHTDSKIASLTLWFKTYPQISSFDNQGVPSANFFNQSSDLLLKLGRVMLEAPLTDLQDAIGKSGASKIRRAMSKLSLWIKSSPNSLETALESIKIIDFFSLTKRSPPTGLLIRDSTPYSIITFFICHITIWAFVTVADSTRKRELTRLIDNCEALNGTSVSVLLKRLLNPQ
jgi:hypothetical protein